MTALLLAFAVLAVAVAGLMAQVLPRSFSPAQVRQIRAWEMGRRWRDWPAGKIFPPAISYQLPSLEPGGSPGPVLTAHWIGTAPQAACQQATDPVVAADLARHGCQAVLRATYVDATRSLAVTVGVAVLPGPAAAQASARSVPQVPAGSLRPSVRAVGFPRTVAAQFGDRQRQLSWQQAAGPYLVFATAGYADGLRGTHHVGNPYATAEMAAVESGIGQWVASHLGAPPPPPKCPGGPAC